MKLTASAATVDGADSVTLTATVTNDRNGDGVKWSVSGGGTFSNTTSTSATYTAPAPTSSPVTVTITATSVADSTKTATVTVTITAKPAITSGGQAGVLPSGSVGVAYSITLDATGGISPYKWTLSSGTLPSCLTLTSAGVLSGTPNATCAGTFSNLVFTVTDSGTPTPLTVSSAPLTITIQAAPAITFTGVMPATATYNAPYTGSAAATGGIGTLTYSSAGALPTGLTLNAGTGAVTGTPTAVGPFSFTVTATDTFQDTASQKYTITVGAAVPTLVFAAIPAKAFGDAPFTVSASSASNGTVTYSVTSGPATINSTSGLVTLTGAGTVKLGASQAASGNYAAATATASVTVSPEMPKLAFAAIPTKTYGVAPFAVSARSASTGAITYSVTSGPATVDSTTGLVTITGAGTVVLGASQAATTNYTSATASATFTVNPETPALVFVAIPTQTYGEAPFTASASSASTGAITYSVVSGPATIDSTTGVVTLTGTGPVKLGASQAASGNYAAATATVVFSVNRGTTALVFAAIPTQTYGNVPFTVSATSASSGAVTYAVTSGPATIGSTTGLVTLTGVGTVNLKATQAQTADYNAATATTSFTVNQETPTLVFAAIPVETYGNAAFKVSASSASSGAVTYSVTSGPATINSATGLLTITGAGTVDLSASQAATADYSAATATTSFTVNPETPTLVFAVIPAKTYGNAPFTVSASSVSSGAVTYSVTSGPATINSTTGLVTLTGAGTVNLSASQAASGNYAAASATASFTVNPEAPTLTFTPIATQTYGEAAFTASASSASTGAITYSVVSGPATINSATGLVTLTGVGVVNLSASQAATTNYTAANATTSFTVNQGRPNLAFAPISTQTYGVAPFTVSASSASSGAVTYSVTSGPASVNSATGLLTITGAGTVNLSASQLATADYAAATAAASFTVNPEAPTLTFAAIPTQTYGVAAFTVSASSASTGAVTYSVTSGPASINSATGLLTITGAGTVNLSASQLATTNYTAATATASFTVNPETPTLTFAAIPTQTYGVAPFTVSASSASTGAVTYTVISGPATVNNTTGLLTLTGAGTVNLSANQAASGNYAAATATTSFLVNPETPTLTFTPIATQTYGAAAFTVSASSASTGAVTYSVTSGPATINSTTGLLTITGVGTVDLSASQAATTNYAATTAATSFAVNQGTPTLTFAPISTQTYGVAAFTVSASSASSGAVTYSVTSGPASVNSTTGLLTITGAGTVVLGASQLATTDYAAAMASTSFLVNPETPTLVFAAIPVETYGDPAFTVSASSASSGAVTYSVTSGPATINSTTGLLTMTGSGTVVLGASQLATTNYSAATASTSFTINPALAISTTSPLPNGFQNVQYSKTLVATGGTGGYKWTTDGPGTASLATVNLTLSLGGAVSGKPLATGTASFSLTVTDSANHTATVPFTVTITNALTITTTSLPAMYTGTLYSQTLTASGGTGLSYSWLTSGTNNLATFNLTLSTGGVLSGTPTSTGTVTFTAQVKDSGNNTAIQAYTIPVYAPVTLPAPNPASLGPATTNVLYSGTIVASGGSGSGYVFTVTGLPSDGLSNAANNGSSTLTIGGTATLHQTVSFTVSVKDGLGNSAGPFTYTIAVNPPTPLLLQTSGALLGATTNVAYNGGITASGGSGQGYVFSINGIPVPTTGALVAIADGISVSNNGTSTLSIVGTPTLTQTVSIATVTVKDSAGDLAGPDTYTIAVNPPTPLTLQTSGALAAATTNQLYGSGIVASGGSGQGYVFSINGIAVPTTGALVAIADGISVSSNGGSTLSVSGTPTTTQTVSIATVTVKDSAGDNAGPDTYTIAVNPPTPLSLQASGSLAAATTNVAYNGGITASGGSGQGYVFTVNNIQIPTTGLAGAVLIADGISVSSNGTNTLTISGTPTLTQEVTLTSVTVKDSANDSAGPDTYTIAVNPPAPLVLQSGGALPSATTNVGYSQSISASGGSGSGYAFTVNNVPIPNTGALVLISDSISVDSNGNGVLNISGSPTSAGSVSLTNVTVKDSANDTAGPETYTIAVITPGSQVSGQIFLLNYCGGNNANVPVITVGIYLTSDLNTPVQTTTTDNSSGNGTGNGNYSFASVPAGTYTVIPSISGPSSLFYPTSSTSFTLSGTPVSGVNFNVSLGYTVSGTVSYTGTNRPTYVELNNNNCGGGGAANGTTVFAPGAFSIRGVTPGSYNLNAWVDELGFGAANATDPTGSLSNLSVSSANLTGEAVTLTAPAPGTSLVGAPDLGPISGFTNGAVVNFNPISNSNNIETPVYYTLEWSTTSTFPAPTSSNSHDFAATGVNGSNTWILNSANVTGLTAGGTYYFRAQGVAGTLTSAWSPTVGPIPLTAPSGANTVTGKVIFTGTAKGPLYVGFYNQNTSVVYATQVGSETSPPTSPASYSVDVPNGSYGFFGIVDQNNNGVISPDDISNTSSNGGPPTVTISSSSPTSLTQDLTLPSAASTVQVNTQLSQFPNGSGGTNSNYYIDLTVNPGIKQPIDVTLTSGPNLINPVDMGICGNSCGHQDFQYSASIGSAVPTVGDTYTFTVYYSDGTTDSTVSGAVSGVITSSALATLISPTGNGISDTPNFDWTYPANPGNYTYQFSICCGSNGFVWEIPGNNSNSNNFTYTQITPPLVWGTDPTNAGNAPSPATLSAGTNYSWNIQSQDSNGNSATAQLNFLTAPGPVSLPAASTSPLPSGIVGAPYSASLNASGGAGGGNYYFKVNGTTIPTNMAFVMATGSDGLTFANSGGNTLFVGGTPTTANASLSLTIEVFDTTNSGDTATVVYTIAINSPTAITLTPAGSIGNAIVSLPFGSEVEANGGTGSGYVFSVTVGSTTTSVPTNGTSVTLSNGLSASNTGSQFLQISGTPGTTTNVPFSVSVVDSGSDSDGPIAYTVDVTSGPNGTNNKYLNGTYVCKVNGYLDSDGTRFASLSSFTANGAAGTTSGGVWDANGTDFSAENSGTSTGTFSVGADNNGIATTTTTVTSGGTGTTTNTYAIALNDVNLATSTATEVRMVEIDDVGASPSGQTSTGVCYQATPAAFTSSTLSGKGIAFGFQGENSGGTPKQYVGRMTLSAETATGGPGGVPGGTVTSGIIDGMRLDQNGNKGGTIASGTYTVPNSNGVYDLSVLATGQTSGSSFVVYVIDANRMFILETAGDTGVQSGDVRTQQQTTYSNSSFNGSAVLYDQRVGYSSGSISGYDSLIYQESGNGAGTLTINQSYDDHSGTYAVGAENGDAVAVAFDSANPGRATFSAGTDSAFLYFYGTNSAFYLDLNGSGSPSNLESGWLLPQTQTTFTNAALAGAYLTADMLEKPGDADVGESDLAGAGSITSGISTGGQNSFTWDESESGLTYSWLNSTYGAFSIVESGQSGGLTCMVITSTSGVCMEGTNGSAKMSVFQQ